MQLTAGAGSHSPRKPLTIAGYRSVAGDPVITPNQEDQYMTRPFRLSGADLQKPELPQRRPTDNGHRAVATAFPAGLWPIPALLVALALAVALITAAASPALARSHTLKSSAPVKATKARILVTPQGRTLYVFAADSKDKSACYGQCATFWPPLLVKSGTTPPSTIGKLPGTFGVAARTDGTQQLTYDGAPLYTFAGDKKKGDMNGQGLVAAGGYWWVVVPGGK
jgi:predicted lipoprotein with Yx(FWY)xxD motif